MITHDAEVVNAIFTLESGLFVRARAHFVKLHGTNFSSGALTNFEQTKSGPIFVTGDLSSSEVASMTVSSCECKGLAVSGIEMREVTAKMAGKLDGITYRRGT